MTDRFVNIHTHRPTGRGIELRTAGIHPWNADKEDVSTIAPLLGDVQAVGETGLDFVHGADRETQLAAFRAQLDACRPRAAIFHGFIGSPEQARRAVLKGYYLSFGLRAFASPKTLESLRETPLSQLFLETDDSDTGIEEVYAHAAAVRGTTVEALKRATTENYERIFAPQNG